MARPLERRETRVYPSYRMFLLYDPTCDASDDLQPAIVEAIAATIGCAPSALAVTTVLDLVHITAQVEIWDQPPPADEDTPDLRREGHLAFPSGHYSIDKSSEDTLRLGLALPSGPGTYRVHVSGHHRRAVQQVRDAAYAESARSAIESAMRGLEGVETYRFRFWRVSHLP